MAGWRPREGEGKGGGTEPWEGCSVRGMLEVRGSSLGFEKSALILGLRSLDLDLDLGLGGRGWMMPDSWTVRGGFFLREESLVQRCWGRLQLV